jgi:uncharacterized protein YmfQ (DUF2313 family)
MKTNKPLYKNFWFIIIVLFCIIAGIVGVQEGNNKQLINNTTDTLSSEKNNLVQKVDQNQELINELTNNLQDVDKTISEFTNETLASLAVKTSYFNDWSELIERAEKNSNDSVRLLAKAFKNKITEIQKTHLPVMRKSFSQITGGDLWEQDVYVTVQGKDNTIINFTGGLFSANKNIADFQNTVVQTLERLRFKEVRYRWYKESDEFTYYKLNSNPDDVIVSL